MKTNFTITDFSSITFEETHIDLHNNFQLQKMSQSGDTIQLQFKKSIGKWVHQNEFECLSFIHKSVTYSHFEAGDNSEFPEDEHTLSELSFFPSSNRETNHSVLDQEKPKKEDDIIYIFENGKVYRLMCEEIELVAIRSIVE